MTRVSLIIASVLMGLTLALSAHAAPENKIVIPALGINTRIYWTASEDMLAHGPAWWPGSSRPGRGQTVAIAGHDVTPVPGFGDHGPFHYLYKLHRGQHIYIEWAGLWYRYRVTSIKKNSGEDTHIADDVGHERLILTTCWPPHSASYRLTIYALPD